MSVLNIVVILVSFVVLALLSIRITRQYDRAVIFRFGRLTGIKGPGPFFILPFVDQIVRVDLRIRQLDVPSQTIITRDNISVDVDAIIYYHVTDAIKAVVEVEDYQGATALIAQTMLRDVLGQNEPITRFIFHPPSPSIGLTGHPVLTASSAFHGRHTSCIRNGFPRSGSG